MSFFEQLFYHKLYLFPHFRPLKCRSLQISRHLWGGNHTPGRSRGVRKVVCAGGVFFFWEVVPRGGDLIERKQQLIIGHEKKRCANLLALLVVGDSDLHEQKQSFKYDEPYLEEIKHETSWIFYASKRHSLVICQNDPCQSRADYEYVLSIRHLDQTWLHKEEQQRWKDEGLYRPHLLEVSFPVAFCQQRFVNSDC